MTIRSMALTLTMTLAACVGDDSVVTQDSGADTSTSDATTGDAGSDAAPPSDGGVDAPVEAGAAKRIFATSATKNGALGGIAGADAMCSAAGAKLGGTFLAWIALANGSSSPASRFTHSGPYKRVDGVVVAKDWTELTSGVLQSKVNVTEDGGTSYDLAWTDTAANGGARTSGYDCAGWTIGDNSQNGCMTNVTSATSLDSPQCSPCYNVNTIICVEQ